MRAKRFPNAIYGFVLCMAIGSLSFVGLAEGFYFEQTVTTPALPGAKPSVAKVWIDKGDVRIDEEQMTVILDQKKNKAISIDHVSKTYNELSLEEQNVSQDIEKEVKEFKKAYQKTGQTKKIDSWNCYEVKFNPTSKGSENLGSTIWFTEDLGINWYDVYMLGQESILQKIKKYSERDKTILDSLPRGFPVLTIASFKGGTQIYKREIRLTKFEKVTVPPEKFKVPEGYNPAPSKD